MPSKRCWNCSLSNSEWGMFCPNCGIRRSLAPPKSRGFSNFVSSRFESLKNAWRKFWVATEDLERYERAMEYAEAFQFYGLTTVVHPDAERAIDELNFIGGMQPKWFRDQVNSILAIFYVMSGEQRVRHLLSTKLRNPFGLSSALFGLTSGAREILESVRRYRRSELSYDAELDLEEKLEGATQMFRQAIWKRPNYHKAYSYQGMMYSEIADQLLLLQGIIPPHQAPKYRPPEPEDSSKWVRYDNKPIGIRLTPETPDPEYAEEIVWLYQQGEFSYREAVKLDPTDTASYIRHSQVLQQLGQTITAENTLRTALTILNKALKADPNDTRSLSERAEVLVELGELDQAICDLEKLLTLSTSGSDIMWDEQRLKDLRKRRDTRLEK